MTTHNLPVLLNGKPALPDFSYTAGETVAQVDARLTTLLSLPKTHRLLLRGRALSDPAAVFAPPPAAALYVLATAEDAVAAAAAAREDPLLRGFGRRPRSRYAAAPPRAAPRPTRFGGVRPLRGKKDEARARAILVELAEDPGFYRVMEERGWSVGELAEMEAEGKVGVDPVCVLGYNTNKGQSIHLRLRTDDGRGFRPMWKLKEVLAHELAHNVHSEHDKNFYALMSDVAKDAKRYDWRESAGRSAGGGGAGGGGGREGRDPLDVDEQYAGPTLNIVERLGSGPSGARPRDASRRPRSPLRDQAETALKPVAADDVIDVDANVANGQQLADRNARGVEAESARNEVMPDVQLPASGKSSSAEGDADPSIPAASEATTPAVPKKPSKPRAAPDVEGLVAMGFPAALATVALRECGGEAARAADWLVNLSIESASSETSGDGGSGDDADSSSDPYVERLRGALGELTRETLTGGVEVSEDALLALHLYVFNLGARPNDARVRQINSMNPAYGRRVGRHAASPSVLRAIGFTLQDSGRWHLDGSVDIARVWLAKSMLVQELQRVCSM